MIKQLYRNVSLENITQLSDNEIFVFGSNRRGIHGKGAALTAYQKFGAVWNVGIGPTGKCYAIPTKNEFIQTLPLGDISKYVADFVVYAKIHKDLKFLVTPIGTGLANYSESEIAPLFFNYLLSDNVYLPKSFWREYDKNIDKPEGRK